MEIQTGLRPSQSIITYNLRRRNEISNTTNRKGKSAPKKTRRQFHLQDRAQDDGCASAATAMPSSLQADSSGNRRRDTTESFYIAHPRHIKRTAHFKDVHSKKLAELLEAFHMFDFDRDGVINQQDLRKTFASLCMEAAEEEIQQMLSEALNPLNFDAFVILLGYKTLELDPEEVLLDALSNWDEHHYGLISYDGLLQRIMAWGDKFTEEQAVSALADAPVVFNKAKEKMIDYIQFSEDLCGLRKMMQRRTIEEGS